MRAESHQVHLRLWCQLSSLSNDRVLHTTTQLPRCWEESIEPVGKQVFAYFLWLIRGMPDGMCFSLSPLDRISSVLSPLGYGYHGSEEGADLMLTVCGCSPLLVACPLLGTLPLFGNMGEGVVGSVCSQLALTPAHSESYEDVVSPRYRYQHTSEYCDREIWAKPTD